MRSVTLLALLALSLHPVCAQEDESVQPEVQPLSVVWEFNARPDVVRDVLLKVLEAEGMALDPDEPEGIVTVFIPFRSKDYGVENVAEEPPTLNDQYLFLQPRKVGQGRLRLRAHLEAADDGTLVRVELDILVRAFHALARGGLAEAVRRSNGAIETYLQGLLVAGLDEAKAAVEKK